VSPPVPFVCPACRSPLESRRDGLRCSACGRVYPVLFEIPDLRISGDRYLDLDADRARAGELDAAARGGASFNDLLELYWRKTPATPPAVAARHVSGALRGLEESLPILEALGGGPLLDVGCGAGGSLVAAVASRRFGPVHGIDSALRWLVIARARLAEAGARDKVTLAAATIESLPFPDGSFDVVLARHLLEHVANPSVALEAGARALRPGGLIGIEAFHRWAPVPEPHVGVFGAAWLPRRLQAPYVRWASGSDYSSLRLPSRREIVRAVREAGLTIRGFVKASTTAGQRQALPRWMRPFVPVHDLLGRSPRWNRAVLSRVGPILRLVAKKESPLR
jgi:ubiquinone/menaquinone biosynthesis C-methylase UbiE/uncharacterized protein YbaR (Trm112 family)